MPRFDRECKTCGDPFYTYHRQATNCIPCRVLNDYTPNSTTDKNCFACGKVFYPIRRTYQLCYQCTTLPGKGVAPCNICGEYNLTAPGMENTCVACVTYSLKNRQAYISALIKRRAELIRKRYDVT